MNDLRLELRFKNAKLFEAIENRFRADRGGRYGCCSLAALKMGVAQGTINGYLTLRISPWIKSRDDNYGLVLATAARKIAEFLELEAEELFPPSLYRLKIPRLAVRMIDSERLLSFPQARAQKLLPSSFTPDYDEKLGAEELADAVANSLASLAPREKEVLERRFGITGAESETLETIARSLNVTTERIRQIEAKALRKMRASKQSRKLEKFIVLPEEG